MRLLPALIAPLAALLAVSANARDVEIAVPAGKAGDAEGGCNLFPGKNVKAAGWCKVWVLKPGASLG